MKKDDQILQEAQETLDIWLRSCTRTGKVARNTVSIGIVVLDHLKRKCPVDEDKVLSHGGEVKNARSGLGNILESYQVPHSYLKEVTTRQGHQDGQKLFELFEWGRKFEGLGDKARERILLNLISHLTQYATKWLKRQSLKMNIDRRLAPTAWIHMIVNNAKERSGGVVEQHLIGAKLERRFKEMRVTNHPAYAGDQQTSRMGDFAIAGIVYHVTANPTRNVIQKCNENIRAGQNPLLLIPFEQENKARVLAQEEGIESELIIVSIESFIALNIVELAADESKDFFSILKEIVDIYNRRLTEVETDLSLQIEVR